MSSEVFLQALMDSSFSLSELSSKWVSKYKEDRDKALLSLLSLIFNSCGCYPKITLDQIDEEAWSETVEKIESEVESLKLSLCVGPGKQKKYIERVSAFIEKMLIIAEDLLYDGFFLLHVDALLQELLKSKFRDFRYTATSVAVKIITALAANLKNLSSQSKICLRDLAVEQNEDTAVNSIDHIKSLEDSYDEVVDEVFDKSSMIKKKLNHLNRKIAERFRDVDKSVRLICIEELEVWIQHHPNMFLDQNSLKYIGWALHDPTIAIRLKSLQILKRIYTLSTLTKDVRRFTFTYKNHILKLSLDKSIIVSVIAIQVIVKIFKRYKNEIFKQEEIDHILKLVYSHNQDVGKEAGSYLHECVLFTVEENSSSSNFLKMCILYLKDFIIRTKGCDGIPFLVDSMIGLPQVKYLTNWKCYSDILLMDKNSLEESHNSTSGGENCPQSLTIFEEKIIIYLMAHSVKQSVLRESPRQKKEAKSLKELRPSDKEKKSAVSHFMEFLPKLMKKYIPDYELIKSLLDICLTFDLKFIREKQNVCEMVNTLMEINDRHIDLGVHLACAKAMKKLCTGSSPIAVFCSSNFLRPYLKEIASNWKMSLAHYADICTKKEDLSLILHEKDLLFSIGKTSQVLWAASCYFFMKDWLEWEELMVLCKGMVLNEKGKHIVVTCEVLKNSLKTALAYILHVKAAINTDDTLFEKLVDEYLFNASGILLSGTNFDYSVRYSAFFCLSEIMCVLHPCLLKSPSTWNDTMEKVTDVLLDFFSAVVLCTDGFENLNNEEKDSVVKEYCSMIMRGGLPFEAAVHLIKNLNTMVITQSRTAVETTLSVLKSWSMDKFTMIILGALTLSYLEINCDEENDLPSTKEFSDLKIFAHQLYVLFGSAIRKNRKAALKFQLKGLHFATTIKDNNIDPLPKIHFVRILTLFSTLVQENDIKNLSQYLKDYSQRLATHLDSIPQEKIYDYLSLLKEYENKLLRRTTH